MSSDQMSTTRADPEGDDAVAMESAASKAWRASRAAANGHLPPRYREWWHPEYYARVEASFRPGMSILDVGAGCNPTIPPPRRPPDCRYVGLDLSSAELEKAPPAGYDDTVAADATDHIASLDGSFDLILSYLVLEHVADLPRVFMNVRSYLRPGGRFIAYFSGAYSAFGLANRALPACASTFLLKTLLKREQDTVFPAYYHRCWASAIGKSMRDWSSVEIKSMWYGAGYFGFFRPLQAAYIGYEEWARLKGYRNLAPYYLVDAVR